MREEDRDGDDGGEEEEEEEEKEEEEKDGNGDRNGDDGLDDRGARTIFSLTLLLTLKPYTLKNINHYSLIG